MIIPWWLKLLVVGLCCVAVYGFGYHQANVAGKLAASELALVQAKAAQASAENVKKAEAERNSHYVQQVSLLNISLRKEQDANKVLAANVAAGPVKLYVHAKCPSTSVVRETTATGGVADERAELDADARPAYFALRDQIVRTEDQLAKCLVFAQGVTVQ